MSKSVKFILRDRFIRNFWTMTDKSMLVPRGRRRDERKEESRKSGRLPRENNKDRARIGKEYIYQETKKSRDETRFRAPYRNQQSRWANTKARVTREVSALNDECTFDDDPNYLGRKIRRIQGSTISDEIEYHLRDYRLLLGWVPHLYADEQTHLLPSHIRSCRIFASYMYRVTCTSCVQNHACFPTLWSSIYISLHLTIPHIRF